MVSLPGQNGQEGEKAGGLRFNLALTKSWGLLALSLAMITHSLVVGSCLISDTFPQDAQIIPFNLCLIISLMESFW